MTRRSALAAMLLMPMAGCGFRLRTWDVSAGFRSVRIDADRSVDVQRDLRRLLEAAGIRIATGTADAADVTIRLAEQRLQRRSVGVTSGGRTAEYEISLRVMFSAAAGAGEGAGEELLPARELRVEQVARLDRDNLSGSREEQAIMERELRRELLLRILRALESASAAAPAPAAD